MSTNNLEQLVNDWVKDTSQTIMPTEISAQRTALLPIVEKYLQQDLPITTLERYETVYKEALKAIVASPCNGKTYRLLAQTQKNIGLALKYKSYTVKATTPLGYSLFLHNPKEGFSFQRHEVHKTEVFHILEVMEGGYVFVCDYEEWLDCYDKASFERWLAGEANEKYDKFKFEPRPGDVFVMDKVGIVHTVIGCVLEEFATTSTDMVERLYDQNAGKPIPEYFNREYAEKKFAQLTFPTSNRLCHRTPYGWATKELTPEVVGDVSKTELAVIELHALQYNLGPHARKAITVDEKRAISLYVRTGEGDVTIYDESELGKEDIPPIAIKRGDVLMIPSGAYYSYRNTGEEPLQLTEQKIPFTVAFYQ